MSSDTGKVADLSSSDTLLYLNRATLLRHTVRTIAHELNNIFQLVSGSAELMGMNPAFPDPLRKKLTLIRAQSARGTEIIDEISSLARADIPRGAITDLGRSVKRVSALRRYEHSRASIDVKVDAPQDPPVIARADPLDVMVMLLNLFINAEQAMGSSDARLIEVAVADRGETCSVTVADTGKGAPAAMDLFAPLMTTKSPAVAAGLGLAATRLLAERHGGRVDVSARDVGLAVTITLPSAPAPIS
jgi:signal transduction histidine kinase